MRGAGTQSSSSGHRLGIRTRSHDSLPPAPPACTARLHRVADNILRDRELAEDATRQALLSMCQALPTLRDPERFEAWAYRRSSAPAMPSRAGPAVFARP
jgi:Sigma-70 region 2